jgi:hypothetical protein
VLALIFCNALLAASFGVDPYHQIDADADISRRADSWWHAAGVHTRDVATTMRKGMSYGNTETGPDVNGNPAIAPPAAGPSPYIDRTTA